MADFQQINLSDFADFCRSMGNNRYPVTDVLDCALGQYARARFPGSECLGLAMGTGIRVGRTEASIEGLPAGFVYDVRHIPGHTGSFADLADRLEALISERDAGEVA